MMNELVHLVLVKLSGPTFKNSVNNNHEKTRGKLCWLRFNFVTMFSIVNIFVRMLDVVVQLLQTIMQLFLRISSYGLFYLL